MLIQAVDMSGTETEWAWVWIATTSSVSQGKGGKCGHIPFALAGGKKVKDETKIFTVRLHV